MTRCISSECIINAMASTWVDFYHAAFVSNESITKENEELQMSAIQADLQHCISKLSHKECDLSERISLLTGEAKSKHAIQDTSGAKRKLMERRRLTEQLQRVTNSISIMDAHSNALEGTELNKSILNTIRASGDAIKRLSVKGGMGTVEDIISEVETQMENASEITKVISAGNITGSLNSMAGLDGWSDMDLEQELDALLIDDTAAVSSNVSTNHRIEPLNTLTEIREIPQREAIMHMECQ
jgi:hypothetical protein